VIAEVNAGELWDGRGDVPVDAYATNSQGQPLVNHAVQVTGTVRDSTGALAAFVINDTGRPDGAANVIPMAVWDRCWTEASGDHETVVTVLTTQRERNR
jgi:hypothetical protein